MLLRATLFLCALASQAHAGAWPRGEGNTFVALNYTLRADPETLGEETLATDSFGALLVERGLSERLTFGFDAVSGQSGDYSAVLYLSRAVGALDAPNRFALHLGAGVTQDGAIEETQAYFGASWGRGLDTRWGNGWSAIDVGAFYRTDSGDVATKADITFGVNPTEVLTVFVQAQAGQFPGSDAYLRVVPSVAYTLGAGPRLELGLPVGLSGDDQVGVKLGTWLDF